MARVIPLQILFTHTTMTDIDAICLAKFVSCEALSNNEFLSMVLLLSLPCSDVNQHVGKLDIPVGIIFRFGTATAEACTVVISLALMFAYMP